MPKIKRPKLTPEERQKIRQEIFSQLHTEEIHIGHAIRRLRLMFTGLNQKQFGKIAGFSATTISAIERDPESGTLKTINQILRKFGMHLTIGLIIRESEKKTANSGNYLPPEYDNDRL